MGANQSMVSPEQFRDQIFSIVLYHIAPKANPTMKFVTPDRCTSDNLPIPDESDLQRLLDFYRIDNLQVFQYLQKHVLNNEENMVRFYQTLINLVREDTFHTTKDSHHGANTKDRTPDPLTRSHLNQIESRPPSLAPEATRAHRNNQTGGRDLQSKSHRSNHRSDNRSKDIKRRPDRSGTDRPNRSIMDKSSHFTMSRVVEEEDEMPEMTGSRLERTKQKLIVNLLERATPLAIDSESDGTEELISSVDSLDSSKRGKLNTRIDITDDRGSSHPREVVYGQGRQTSRNLEEDEDLGDYDENTMKHMHRFKDKCMIAENFD